MAATLTLCASRKMLSSVCLLPMPLAFHCSMLNILFNMVGMWPGLDGGVGTRGCGGVLHGSMIIRNVSKTRTFRMYPMRASCCIQVAGILGSDVLETDRAGVPWRAGVRVHITGKG